MRMIPHIGVEIRARGIDNHFLEQTGRGELMQRIVNRRQSHRNAGRDRFPMQVFRADVALLSRRGSDRLASSSSRFASSQSLSIPNSLPMLKKAKEKGAKPEKIRDCENQLKQAE